jgi:hypothetical protein
MICLAIAAVLSVVFAIDNALTTRSRRRIARGRVARAFALWAALMGTGCDDPTKPTPTPITQSDERPPDVVVEN